MNLEEMSDREADAEFAEKVLGCNPVGTDSRGRGVARDKATDFVCRCGEVDDLGNPEGQHNTRQSVCYGLACFTRSLDAAWKGVEKLTAHSEGYFSLGYDGNEQFAACFYHDKVRVGDAIADHPARAVVLACLKAVEGKHG